MNDNDQIYISYNYWCQDCNCGKTGSGQDHVITKLKSEEDEEEFCPNYDHNNPTIYSDKDPQLKDGQISMKLMGIKTNCSPKAFGSLSPSEKQSALKKRSQEHYKKEIDEVKRHKLKHE